MKKFLSYLFLALGVYNVYEFVRSFIVEISQEKLYFFFWETGIMGYRIKCLIFAVIFLGAFWSGYKRGEV